MFERFTRNAREVVTGAVTHAERTDAASVSEEHLLLALLDRQEGRAAFAAASLGLVDRRASVEAELATARRHGGLTRADTDALAGLGIDVTEIVARVEEAHGEGALDRARRRGARRRPFGRGAKGILTRSLRIAAGRGDRFIGDEHLLLALTACPGVAAEVLAAHGATYGTVSRALYGGGEEGERERFKEAG
ncbi:Clp protease N-terminal domain-containing protein [Streptomyces sp. NBC_00893]|uniref:Clp protease N-terminal domain-containing protein n=1 Tax=Streptomyces sp. NBC_00893 TaxID=2975862 RepID=UPI0022558F70|nr:Clp protease N-terminal domain-containing protein [Streptomyces sp. NBC_00893]MCX4845299.1 peptidase [Streptomyces sp. NBC_00893]